MRTLLSRLISLCVFLLALGLIGLTLAFQPSHERQWELGQEKLPRIIMHGDNITIENFRDFDWKPDEPSTEPRYVTKVFNKSLINSVDVFISHFSDFEGLAHIFVSFGTEAGEHIIVSFETRREVGEEFSPTLGILRQFEIIYVVGSEADVIGVRTDVRNERVYLHPTTLTKDEAQELFVAIANDVNAIYEKPRIYNTITHNCLNDVFRRVEQVTRNSIPFTWRELFPGYYHAVLQNEGLVVYQGDVESMKRDHLIDNTTVDRHSKQYEAELRR